MTTTIGNLISVKARLDYERLVALTSTADFERQEVNKVVQFLAKS